MRRFPARIAARVDATRTRDPDGGSRVNPFVIASAAARPVKTRSIAPSRTRILTHLVDRVHPRFDLRRPGHGERGEVPLQLLDGPRANDV